MSKGNEVDPKHRLRALGRAIKAARGDLSQAEVGAQLGVPQSTVSRWERGGVDLGYEQVHQIEEVLDVEFGSIGKAAGFVEDAEPDLDTTSFREMGGMNFQTVTEMLAAAVTLDLGVKVWNYWTTQEGGEVLEWTVQMATEPPGLPS